MRGAAGLGVAGVPFLTPLLRAGARSPEDGVGGALEAENAALRAETTKLTTEREILRQAAKYFAGETNW